MPFGDQTGPAGAGPMTGRGFGYCSNHYSPGYFKNYGGRGRGFGWNNCDKYFIFYFIVDIYN